MFDEAFISKRISTLRLQKNVSARDMSLSLGQSESYINKIENGRTLPSMSVFLYICEYFGITPSEFFKEKVENPSLINELNIEASKISTEQLRCVVDLIHSFTK